MVSCHCNTSRGFLFKSFNGFVKILLCICENVSVKETMFNHFVKETVSVSVMNKSNKSKNYYVFHKVSRENTKRVWIYFCFVARLEFGAQLMRQRGWGCREIFFSMWTEKVIRAQNALQALHGFQIISLENFPKLYGRDTRIICTPYWALVFRTVLAGSKNV